MMFRQQILGVFLIGCCVLAGGPAAGQVRAGGTEAYLSVIPDIPLMQGLREDVSESVIFDKEQGKVAETVVFGENITPEEVNLYYRETLGQLGWKAQNTGFFLRNDEQLIVKVEKVGSGVKAVLSLSPKMP